MTRNEFLKKLNEELKMSLDKSAINEHVDYYDKYISDEVKAGRKESEVIEELGDPALIAKTIKTVTGTEGVVDADINDEKNTGSKKRSSTKYVYTTGTRATIGCVIVLLIMFIIMMSIFRLLGYVVVGTTGVLFGLGPFSLFLILLIVYLFSRKE